jgi:hypothetical protein
MEPKLADPPSTLAENTHADGAGSEGDEAGGEAEEHEEHGHSEEENDGIHSLDAGSCSADFFEGVALDTTVSCI